MTLLTIAEMLTIEDSSSNLFRDFFGNLLFYFFYFLRLVHYWAPIILLLFIAVTVWRIYLIQSDRLIKDSNKSEDT